MPANGFVQDLTSFFKTARHLWGRCPHCDLLFRLSDAAITSSPEPPKDWLRRLERKQNALNEKEDDIAFREDELQAREVELSATERDIERRERNIESTAHRRVRDILGSKTEIRALIRDERRAAVKTSRATLLGKLLERLAPCFRTFAYDPRDMRCISDPFDYVLFDGLTGDRHVKQIAFIEVKCGKGRMTPVQRSVREAVDKSRVFTEVWEVGNPNIPITKQLPAACREKLPLDE